MEETILAKLRPVHFAPVMRICSLRNTTAATAEQPNIDEYLGDFENRSDRSRSLDIMVRSELKAFLLRQW